MKPAEICGLELDDDIGDVWKLPFLELLLKSCEGMVRRLFPIISVNQETPQPLFGLHGMCNLDLIQILGREQLIIP